MDFRFYLSLFLRRLPYFLILLALGSALGLTLATVLPPVYVARATLLVESQQIPSDLATSTVQTAASEQLQIIQQRILTRASLLEMANRLNIYAADGAAPAARMPADEIVDDLRRRININTSGSSNPRGVAQATIVSVSFEAPTGQLAAAVANELVTLILQENVSIRTNVAGGTLDFFVEEVARLDKELAAKGAAILAFQQGNLNALPDSLDFRRSQQAAAQERLLQLERDEATLRDRRNRLVDLYESTGQVGPGPTAAAQTPEARQLQALRDQLSGSLAILAPANPRIRMLEAQIAAMEATVAAQSGTTTTDPGGAQLSAYEIQLADIDGQLKFIADQKAQISAAMEELRRSIEATPGNAITLDTLQRDYAAVRQQYDNAVGAKARAETGDTIEALAKGQRITVIEQAIAPREPDSPNRPLLAAAGIGGGLMLGLGLVVLLEALTTAIRRPADLTSRLGITPFATLPRIRTRSEILRRRGIMAGAFAAVLIGLPLGLWFVHTEVTPLDLLFYRTADQLGLSQLLGLRG